MVRFGKHLFCLRINRFDLRCYFRGAGMSFDLQQVINSLLSLRLVSLLAQLIPPRVGYRVADSLAVQIARQKDSKVVRAVRANQCVANEKTLEGDALSRVVREVFRFSAHSLFDLYHYSRDFEATRQLIVFDSSFTWLLQRPEFDQRGLVVAGLHLSSFDLICFLQHLHCFYYISF